MFHKQQLLKNSDYICPRMGKRAIICIAFLFTGYFISAQAVNTAPGSAYAQLINRYRVLEGKTSDTLHTSFAPHSRNDLRYTLSGWETKYTRSVDKFNMQYLHQDNWELVDSLPKSKNPVFKHFYQIPSAFYHVNHPGFSLNINPVLHFSGGRETGNDELLYVNTRGIEVRSTIDDKVSFYTYIGENQLFVPQYVVSRVKTTQAIPHEGFWKDFKGTGYDFFNIRGYISFNATRHINVQFGQDRFKAGQGMRSLILSDYAPSYPFLKLNTKVWKFSYTNLFTQFTQDLVSAGSGLSGTTGFPVKYMAFHHLSLNIGKKFNLGFFESVMYGAPDGERARIEVKYLNPVIFYRAVEHQNGSTDNVILGMDAEWIIHKGIALYGQLILDEFYLKYLKEGNGWWANKYGIQAGINYYNVAGVDNLDLTTEFNTVRPYTYSHYTPYGSYSHYRQPLAHPLGANFKEVAASLRYQPLPRLSLTGKVILAGYGQDTTGVNWGGNILMDNRTKVQVNGNFTGQGIYTRLSYVSFKAAYMLKHNLFLDASALLRREESELALFSNNTKVFGIALRLNIADRLHEF